MRLAHHISQCHPRNISFCEAVTIIREDRATVNKTWDTMYCISLSRSHTPCKSTQRIAATNAIGQAKMSSIIIHIDP